MLQSMTNNPFIHNFWLSLPLKSYSYQGQLTNLHSDEKNIYGQVCLNLLNLAYTWSGGEIGKCLGRGEGGGFGVGRG